MKLLYELRNRHFDAVVYDALYDQQDGVCPGCDMGIRYGYGDVHHCVTRAKLGPDWLENGALLCRECHNEIDMSHMAWLKGFLYERAMKAIVARVGSREAFPKPGFGRVSTKVKYADVNRNRRKAYRKTRDGHKAKTGKTPSQSKRHWVTAMFAEKYGVTPSVHQYQEAKAYQQKKKGKKKKAAISRMDGAA